MSTKVGTGQPRVRRLQPADFELAAAAIRCVKMADATCSLDSEYIRHFLARPENILVVAEQDGVPTGFLLAYLLDRVDRNRSMACLYEIAVTESHRRQGIGRAMIETLKSICTDNKVMKTWVITNRSNVAACRLYESTGGTPNSSGDELSFLYTPGK